MDATNRPFVKVEKDKIYKYKNLYSKFRYFQNYIEFAFDYLTPELRVNSTEHPTHSFFYTPPAYMLQGNPDEIDVTPVFAEMLAGSWIVAENDKWEKYLSNFFKDRLEMHQRTAFDARSLNLDHLRALKTDIPEGLSLVQIDEKHVRDEGNMLYQDLLQNYFASADFLKEGVGFCVMSGEKMLGFAAANYPLKNQILEVYVRVGFTYDTEFRQKGLGMALCKTLLQYCLERGIEPQWDAANEISTRMALKLGYTVAEQWNMYHIA